MPQPQRTPSPTERPAKPLHQIIADIRREHAVEKLDLDEVLDALEDERSASWR